MIIIAVVILLLGCWVFNVTCGSKKKVDTSNLSEYANRVSSLVEASNALAQTWTSIQANLVQLIATPEILNDQLKAVEDQCKELLDQVRALEVPEAVRDVNYALLMCFEGRYRAMKNYRPDLVNAISAADTQVYTQNISDDLQELMRSDGSYYYYKRSMSESLSENNIADTSLPDSVWLPNWDQATAESVRSMLISLKGTEVHGLALGGVTLSPAGRIVEEGGEAVHRIPYTQEISITISIQNQGSRAEKDVVVSVSLYSTANPAPTKQEQTIASIGPGETVQVVFAGLKPKTGGVRNVLEVKAGPVPLETLVDNNQKLIYFTVE
ncbi:MAG: hypothetical protein A2W01_00615 [Candidatus Solincola sediminis]|nr:MAG: hypothetical protein A2W01_00615 [Candidatus Solincola sediminis]